jgi:hypothetical protein
LARRLARRLAWRLAWRLARRLGLAARLGWRLGMGRTRLGLASGLPLDPVGLALLVSLRHRVVRTRPLGAFFFSDGRQTRTVS